jgi:hypothetical protein
MKIKISVLIIMLGLTSVSYAFDGETHKYLTIQAWELVRYQHPEVIGSEMDIAMSRGHDYTWGGYDSGPWSSGCIVNGSFREDCEDPAFHEEFRELDCGIFGSERNVFTTASHFWSADNGFNHHFTFDLGILCCGEYGYFNNTYEKLIAYGQGLSVPWAGNYKYNIPWGPYTLIYNGDTVQALLGISYEYLYDAYHDGLKVPCLYILEHVQIGGIWVWMYVEHNLSSNEPLSNFITSTAERSEIQRLIFWEQIGRMCHLFEDMGVPAHVHLDYHPANLPFYAQHCIQRDYYELFYIPYNRTSKNYMDAYNEGGIRYYPYSWSPEYVFTRVSYIINQIGDRFGSNNEWGDLNYQYFSDPLAGIYANIGNVTTEPGKGNEVQDVLFANSYTYMMRQIGGWLYFIFNYVRVQPGIPQDLVLKNWELPYGMMYKAYNSITLDSVIVGPGSDQFIAGNVIKIKDSHIHPAMNTYFKIQSLGDNFNTDTNNPVISYDSLTVDESYSTRQKSTIIWKSLFNNNESKKMNSLLPNANNSYAKKETESSDIKNKKSLSKENSKVKDRTKKLDLNQDAESNLISPESYFGEMVISLINNDMEREDVTALVNHLDSMANQEKILKNLRNLKTNLNGESNLIPAIYFLSQNYPNPFNPSTTIKYGLKQNVNVSLKIYDILGREIKTLVNEFQNAGYKSVLWDGRNNNGAEVSSGVYFCKIIAGDFVDVKKMAVIK